MLKRIVWICIALVAIAWFAQSKIENNRIVKARLAEEQRIKSNIKENVTALERSTGATMKWVEPLRTREKSSFNTILSIELEKAWVENSPILFFGSIHDIANLNETHYQIIFEQDIWYASDLFDTELMNFDTELKLSLKADKKLIDEFMAQNPKFLEDYFNRGVALAAKIQKIESSLCTDAEGFTPDVKIGVGDLLGLELTGYW